MAAITAYERQELVALYLTMLGTAPSTIKLAQLVIARESGQTFFEVAATLATDMAFAAVESRGANSFASYLAGKLLANDVPATAHAWATNWVVTQVQGGKSKAQISAEAVQAIRATDNPNYTTSQAKLVADIEGALLQLGPVVDSKTYSLTANATDIVNAPASDDMIIGQLGTVITLQASDQIDGGGGNDVFRIVSYGADAQNVSGFTVSNVETLEVDVKVTAGTSLGIENVSGLSTLRSTNSTGPLTLNNIKTLTPLEIREGAATHTVTLNYRADAMAGNADTQQVLLNKTTLGTLTVNGIETLAFTTSSADSTVGTIVGNALKSVTVAGDKMLNFTAALPTSVKTVDASAQTAGGISILANNNVDLSVKGGAGNDTVTFSGTLTNADFFDGGAGRDTIVANVIEFLANSYSVASRIRNVEVIHFANILTTDVDASMFTGVDTYVLGAGFLVPVTISKATDGSTLDIRGSSYDTLTYRIGEGATLSTAPGTNNTLNIAVGATFGLDVGTLDASGIETLALTSNGAALTAAGNVLTIIDGDVTSLSVAGAGTLTLTLNGTALTTLDASASTGDNDFSLVTFKNNAAATIKGGAGADKLKGSAAGDTIDGGAGADLIAGHGGADMLTGGAGVDTFYFSTVGDSSGSAVDTITDFVSGTDLLNIGDLARLTGRFNIVLRGQSAATFADAQLALVANSGNTQVVFQADNHTLWVDLNDDAKLDANDLSVKLPGVTKITSADVGGTARPDGFGNFITLIGNNAILNGSVANGANLVTTLSDDSIWSTLERIATITSLDGLAGIDTLNLTDAGSITIPGTVTNVERLTLATVGTTPNTLVFNAISFTTLTGSANADTVTTANMSGAAGAVIALGAGADILNVSASLPGTAIDMGADDDVVNLEAGVIVAGSLAGGGGNDTLNIAVNASVSAAALSGFETLNFNGDSDYTLAATLDATRVRFGAGNDTITTVTANASTTLLELGGGNDTITTLNIGVGNLTIDFGAGNGTISNLNMHGSGKLTLKFAAPASVSSAISIDTFGANLARGDVIDFAAAGTAVVVGQMNGTNGSAGAAGQIFVDSVTHTANTIITFDADGSRTLTAGDVQITLVGNVVSGTIDGNGNFAITASS